MGVGTKFLSERVTLQISLAGMTSPHGRCHTLDARADGYCRGEGSGAFVLGGRRTLRSSRILGSCVQQDGPSASLTAPNGSSQRRLVHDVTRQILAENVRSPALEAHGTGTALGDPIEVEKHIYSSGLLGALRLRL